jgi:hypothetical protein
MEKGYWLTERQAILTAILSDTLVAQKIRHEIVDVIYALRHGDKVPPMPVLDGVLKDFPWERRGQTR